MTKLDAAQLDRAINDLPVNFKGPGGAVAVVKDGAVVTRQAWGFADLERHVPFSASTLFPICSISKQFTCAVLLDEGADPSRLDAALQARLPLLSEKAPRVLDLCHNQSGLRDYWALTVLCGAAPEGAFNPADARNLFGRTRTLHFQPGMQYSYSNGNFRLLADLIEDSAGRPFEEMLQTRVLARAGMETARFGGDTSDLPGGAVGYDGNEAYGFVPAVNRIHWKGDAGVVASLDDMIAWERFIDATRDDPDGLYRRLSRPTSFADGRPAHYGFGLARLESDGVAITGHGGALRGWRSQRLHAAQERLSVVVLLNHAANPHAAALAVMRAALGQKEKPKPAMPYDARWSGAYHDAETGLVLDISSPHGAKGQLAARFTSDPDLLDLAGESEAASPAMTLRRDGDSVHMIRPSDNLRSRLTRIEGPSRTDVTGTFHSAELGSIFNVVATGSAIFGSFEGFLGQSAMQPLYPVGSDLWRMPCQRSMDAPAPGDWTLHFHRDQSGKITGVTVGCWLARQVRFEKRD